MKVIAVVQLDRLIRKLDKLDSAQVNQVLLSQVQLLKHCHNVSEWLFMANPESISRLCADFHLQISGRLISTLNGDPLDEFYRAASHRARASLPENGKPLIVRIIPGLEDIQPQAIDAILENHILHGYDYSRGHHLDDGKSAFLEVMNYAVLDEAWREALLPDDREQITPYIYRQNSRLSLGTYNISHENTGSSARHASPSTATVLI